ncbi:MAG: ribonuclease HI [Planctomycetes bacterium]|nr:ribonuclease HI [Planctomycetota bacterium]
MTKQECVDDEHSLFGKLFSSFFSTNIFSLRTLASSNRDTDRKIVRIYSDGACSNNQQRKNFGGWGAVLFWGGKSREIFGGEADTTNQRMELTAIVKALGELKVATYPVEIYSDSAYIVDCITKKWYAKWLRNGWLTSSKEEVKNRDLWMALLDLLAPLEVSFIKVKGHAGDEGNERADFLARRGVEEIKNAVRPS